MMQSYLKNLLKNSFLYLICLNVIGIIPMAHADTIANYMTIVDNIPKMAMKPDEQAQAWVRSARNIITSTDETMVQTIIAINAIGAKQGKPIFCFSPGVPFDAGTADKIIQKTYAELLRMQGTSVANMTVSDVLVIGMASQYSCGTSPSLVQTPIIPSASLPAFTPQSSVIDNNENNPYATPTQVSVSAESPPIL